MKIKDFLTSIKTMTGTTGSELTIAGILLLGLIFGSIIKAFDKDSYNETKINPEVFRILDSLAENARLTYKGTDAANNPGLTENTITNDSIITKSDSAKMSMAISKNTTKADRIKGIIIDLNKASKAELVKLPNVGEKTAVAIIEFRKNHPFRNISDIKKIKGIGEKKFESMKEFIEVR